MTKYIVIDKALSAVFNLFKSQQDESDIKAYIDDSESSLHNLAEALVLAKSTGEFKVIPILIRIEDKNTKNLHPYSNLLGQLLKEKKLGIDGFIHLIVPTFLQYLQDNGDLGEQKHTVLIERASKRFQARIPDIQESEHLKMAVASLLDWAKLESYVSVPATPFCRLAGGVKPVIYVFDDYINFIEYGLDPLEADSSLPPVYKLPRRNNGKDSSDSKSSYYLFNKENSEEPEIKLLPVISKFYSDTSSSQAENLVLPLKGFAGCLNNLSVVFNVQAPSMEFEPPETVELNYFQQVAKLLNFSKLDKDRNQIAAFIIDIEWLPSPKWIRDTPDARKKWINPPNNDQMGYYAVRLLTQRYPEIPCFVFTGMWRTEILQKSLTAGAAWCFRKPNTHHLSNESLLGEELNYFSLDYHLTEFTKRTYSAYEQLPKPDQFNALPDSIVVENLNTKVEKIGVKFSHEYNEDNTQTKNFKKLISGQFTANYVNPTKVLSGGKSGALATFFVQPSKNKSKKGKEATRFLKIDSWQNTQIEYFAYQHIIRPRLNNHVAHIIQKPSVTLLDTENSKFIGVVTSSLAGFPEDYSKLKTLKEIIDQHIDEPDGVKLISKKIDATLEMVLLPLYQNYTSQKYWMGEDFFHCYEGDLITLDKISDQISESIDVDDVKEAIDSANRSIIDTSSLDCLKGAGEFYIKGWQIAWLEDWITTKYIVLTHPLLRHQVRLEAADVKDFDRRFNGLSLKPNMRVELAVKLKQDNSLIKRYEIEIVELSKKHNSYNSVEELIESLNLKPDKESMIANPYNILNGKKYTFDGIKSVRHGDLNPNNILYPEDDAVGFLIDFARTKDNELIAFDFAWLEAQLWNYYVLPRLVEITMNLERSSLTLHQALFLSLKLLDPTEQDIDSWKFSHNLPSSLNNAFAIVRSIRQFIIDKLPGISLQEQNYCLGVSFLRHSRFSMNDEESVRDKIKVMSFLASAYYLSKMPQLSPT
jgi:Ternary complex associated domain 9